MLLIVGQDGGLGERSIDAVVGVGASERIQPINATDGGARGQAILHYKECLLAMEVEVLRLAGLVVLHDGRVLRILQDSYSPSVVLGSAFNPTDAFLYVLDEAQVAGQRYMGAFADEGGTIPRPVLRPIIKCFSTPTFAKVIVSGTGFTLGLCKSSLASGVGKDSEDWAVVRSTGDFYTWEIQLDYISRHLPPSFL